MTRQHPCLDRQCGQQAQALLHGRPVASFEVRSADALAEQSVACKQRLLFGTVKAAGTSRMSRRGKDGQTVGAEIEDGIGIIETAHRSLLFTIARSHHRTHLIVKVGQRFVALWQAGFYIITPPQHSVAEAVVKVGVGT